MVLKYGYWTPVHDQASAEYAVRMSGLPVLVMAVNPAIAALIMAVQPDPNPPRIVLSSLLAVMLVLLAFRVRMGRAGWLPLVLAVFTLFLAARAFAAFAVWDHAGGELVNGTMVVIGWVIPLICTVLVFGGVRGWRWMVANGVAVRY